MTESEKGESKQSISRDRIKKLKTQSIISLVIFVIGVILLILKIYADSEPGGIPILLVLLSLGWYFITRIRIRAQIKKPNDVA